MSERTQYVFLGDKDLARSHTAQGQRLVASGSSGTTTLLDGSTIHIARSDSTVTCTISSPMHADIAVVVNRFADSENNAYYTHFYGYNHRKDSMHPYGRWDSGRTYGAPWDLKSGPEIAYITAGMFATNFYHFNSGYGNPQGTPETFLHEVQICSMLEDRITGDPNWGTSRGYKTYGDATAYTWSSFWHSNNGASMMPIGTLDGTYRVASAGHILMDNFDYSYPYGPSNSFKYGFMKVTVTRHELGPNGQSSGSYYLADDVMYWGESTSPYGETSFVSPAPPILLPLGPNKVMIVYRKLVASANKVFGGVFTYDAKIIGGQPGLTIDSVANLEFTPPQHRTGSSWHFGDVGSPYTPKPVSPMDAARDFYFQKFLSNSSRLCAVAGEHTVYFAGNHWWLTQDKDLLVPDNPWDAEIVCYKADLTGITLRGSIFRYYNLDTIDEGDGHPYYTSNNIPRYRATLIGMVHGGAVNTLFCYLAIEEYSPVIMPSNKVKRFKSTDGGATWDTGTDCTFENPNDGNNAYFIRSPTYLSGVEGSATIAMGYTRANVTTSFNTEYKQVAIQIASDDGITFKRSPWITQDADYTRYFGFRVPGQVRGDSVLLDCGNYIEGFRPSPYRNVPTFYGTDAANGQRTRDNTDDFGA